MSLYDSLGNIISVVTVDPIISTTSENPVQNKAVKSYVDTRTEIDETPTEGSNHSVSSNGTYQAIKEAAEFNNWKGKKIQFDGTSLFFQGKGNMPHLICEQLGATEVITTRCDGGSIGTATLHGSGYSGKEYYFRTRLANYQNDIDALVLELDANSIPTSGTIDTTAEDGTWYGNWNNYLRLVRETYPVIPVFVISDWTTKHGSTVRKYALMRSNAARELCAVHGCIHIDMGTLSQFHHINSKAALAFSYSGSDDDDHQRAVLANKYLYRYIASRINDYYPIEEDSETGIELSVNSISLEVGEVKTVNAILLPNRQAPNWTPSTVWQTNTWKSADEDIALACGAEILGVSEGNTTVTVKSRHGYTATLYVTVSA